MQGQAGREQAAGEERVRGRHWEWDAASTAACVVPLAAAGPATICSTPCACNPRARTPCARNPCATPALATPAPGPHLWRHLLQQAHHRLQQRTLLSNQRLLASIQQPPQRAADAASRHLDNASTAAACRWRRRLCCRRRRCGAGVGRVAFSQCLQQAADSGADAAAAACGAGAGAGSGCCLASRLQQLQRQGKAVRWACQARQLLLQLLACGAAAAAAAGDDWDGAAAALAAARGCHVRGRRQAAGGVLWRTAAWRQLAAAFAARGMECVWTGCAPAAAQPCSCCPADTPCCPAGALQPIHSSTAHCAHLQQHKIGTVCRRCHRCIG